MARRGENIYKRKDGRYEGRYVIGKKDNGCTRFGYIFGHTYAEVHSKLIETKAMQLKTGNPKPKRMGKVKDYMDKWIHLELRPRIKASSYQTYTNLLNRHILPHLGEYDITEITQEMLSGYIQKLREAGLADATITGIFTLLKSAMKEAQEQGLITANPCRKLRVRKDLPKKQRVLSIPEQEKLYKDRKRVICPASSVCIPVCVLERSAL